MMMIFRKNSEITDIWARYQAGIDYNNRISYKATVNKNERFYAGDQWRGLKKDDRLPAPVFNTLKRIVDSKVSYILSQPYKIRYLGVKGDYTDPVTGAVSKRDGIGEKLTSAAAYHWEKDNLDFYLRRALLKAAISGDMCAHVYMERTEGGTDAITGDFSTEILNGINVFFGNVNEPDAQKQPYIIIARRALTESLKAEAKANGLSSEEIKKILPDSDYDNEAGDRGVMELDKSEKTTYVTMYYKKNGKVYVSKSTKAVTFVRDKELNLTRYPIVWGNWIPRENSYHGEAEITYLLSTQLYFNKQMALAQKSQMDTAFPTVVYDKTRIVGEWTNAVGKALPTNGSINDVARVINGGQMDSGVLAILDRTLNTLYQSTGITDALTGEMRPENTSAIIALQKAAATALDMQRASVLKFIEDLAEVWLDFMRSTYGGGKTLYVSTEDGLETVDVDSNTVKEMVVRTRIDVGASTMWSETLAVETLSNMLSNGFITPKQFLERLPRGVIPKTDELIQEIAQQQQEQQQAAALQTQGGYLMPETPGGDL